MRILLTFLLLSGLGADSFAQGIIYFGTFNFAPVTNQLTGQLIPAGPDWWAQLYYGREGAGEDELIAVTNSPVHFAVDGYILNSSPYYTDAAVVPAAALGNFQIRVWAASLGDSWEQAYSGWLNGPCCGALGKSNVGTVWTADPYSVTPGAPSGLLSWGPNPIRGFVAAPVPEPGVLALGLAGAIALRWHRRKVH